MRRMVTMNPFHVPQLPLALQHMHSVLMQLEKKKQGREREKITGPIFQILPDIHSLTTCKSFEENINESENPSTSLNTSVILQDPIVKNKMLSNNLIEKDVFISLAADFQSELGVEKKRNEELLLGLEDAKQKLTQLEDKLNLTQEEVDKVCQMNKDLQSKINKNEDNECELSISVANLQKSLNDIVQFLTRRQSDFERLEVQRKEEQKSTKKKMNEIEDEVIHLRNGLCALNDNYQLETQVTLEHQIQKFKQQLRRAEGLHEQELNRIRAIENKCSTPERIETRRNEAGTSQMEAQDRSLQSKLSIHKLEKEEIYKELRTICTKLEEYDNVKDRVHELENLVKELALTLKLKEQELKQLRYECVRGNDRLKRKTNLAETHECQSNFGPTGRASSTDRNSQEMVTCAKTILKDEFEAEKNLKTEIRKREEAEIALSKAQEEIQRQRMLCQDLEKVLSNIEDAVVTPGCDETHALQYIVSTIRQRRLEEIENKSKQGIGGAQSKSTYSRSYVETEIYTNISDVKDTDMDDVEQWEREHSKTETGEGVPDYKLGKYWTATSEDGFSSVINKYLCCPRRNPRTMTRRKILCVKGNPETSLDNSDIFENSTNTYQLEYIQNNVSDDLTQGINIDEHERNELQKSNDNLRAEEVILGSLQTDTDLKKNSQVVSSCLVNTNQNLFHECKVNSSEVSSHSDDSFKINEVTEISDNEEPLKHFLNVLPGMESDTRQTFHESSPVVERKPLQPVTAGKQRYENNSQNLEVIYENKNIFKSEGLDEIEQQYNRKEEEKSQITRKVASMRETEAPQKYAFNVLPVSKYSINEKCSTLKPCCLIYQNTPCAANDHQDSEIGNSINKRANNTWKQGEDYCLINVEKSADDKLKNKFQIPKGRRYHKLASYSQNFSSVDSDPQKFSKQEGVILEPERLISKSSRRTDKYGLISDVGGGEMNVNEALNMGPIKHKRVRHKFTTAVERQPKERGDMPPFCTQCDPNPRRQSVNCRDEISDDLCRNSAQATKVASNNFCFVTKKAVLNPDLENQLPKSTLKAREAIDKKYASIRKYSNSKVEPSNKFPLKNEFEEVPYATRAYSKDDYIILHK